MVFQFIQNAVVRQVGGGRKDGVGMFTIFIVLVIFLCIQSYLVKTTYNLVAPRLIQNNGGDLHNFRYLGFWEGVMLVILTNNLFSK